MGHKIDLANVKDKLGKVIHPGDYIAYGSLLGRCAALRIGKVLDIRKRELGEYGVSSGVSIIVWGVDDGFNEEGEYEDNDYVRPTVLCMKRGALQFPERTIVLRKEDVPEKYRKLLDPVTLDRKGTTWMGGGVQEEPSGGSMNIPVTLLEAFVEQKQSNCDHVFHPLYTYCLECKKPRDIYSDVVQEGSFSEWTFQVNDFLPFRTLQVSPDVWEHLKTRFGEEKP